MPPLPAGILFKRSHRLNSPNGATQHHPLLITYSAITLNTARATHAMAVAPHHLAAQSAIAVMRDGGNAIEAMIAAAATFAVVYAHMNGINGDSFWLVVPSGGEPIAIGACGAAPSAATIEAYRSRAHTSIPVRGPLAANTVAGAVGGWLKTRRLSTELGGVHTVLARHTAGGFGPHHSKPRRQQAADIPAPVFHRQTGDPR